LLYCTCISISTFSSGTRLDSLGMVFMESGTTHLTLIDQQISINMTGRLYWSHLVQSLKVMLHTIERAMQSIVEVW